MRTCTGLSALECNRRQSIVHRQTQIWCHTHIAQIVIACAGIGVQSGCESKKHILLLLQENSKQTNYFVLLKSGR